MDRGKTPSISVITVTLNCVEPLKVLQRCLLMQSDADFEWVVVDGGSTDGTLDLVRQFPAARLKLISEPDFGIYHALNKAIRLATGDYYLVVGSDDELQPDAVHRFRVSAIKNRADIVAASVRIDSRVIPPLSGARWRRGGNAYLASHAVSTLFRRDLHARFGDYSNRYVNAADMYFALVAIRSGASVSAADFIAGRFGSGGVSSRDRLCSATDLFRMQLSLGESRLPQLSLLFMRLFRWLYSGTSTRQKQMHEVESLR